MLSIRDRFSLDFASLVFAAILTTRRFSREFLLSYLRANPHLRDILLGAGAALDPLPKCYRQTFIRDDHLAMLEDWMTVGEDMRATMGRFDAQRSRRSG